MKAARSLRDQETIVAWNEEEADGVIFTASLRVLHELEKRGYVAEPAEDYSGPGVRMVLPKRDIALPSPCPAAAPTPEGQKSGRPK